MRKNIEIIPGNATIHTIHFKITFHLIDFYNSWNIIPILFKLTIFLNFFSCE